MTRYKSNIAKLKMKSSDKKDKAMEKAAKEKKHKLSKIIYIAIGCIYLVAVIGATVYAQTIYVDNLPAVTLTKSESRGIEYTIKAEGELRDGEVVALYNTNSNPFPGRVLNENCTIKLNQGSLVVTGKYISSEFTGTNIEIRIKPDEGLEMNKPVQCEIDCDTSEPFDVVVPRSALGIDFVTNSPVLNMVDQTEGPWGKKYVITQKPVVIWPYEDSEYVMIFIAEDIELPIAKNVDTDFIYTGMEVRISN